MKKGTKIRCKGMTVTVNEVLYADKWDGKWDVEFIDSNGNYRHWKQELDGGEVIE